MLNKLQTNKLIETFLIFKEPPNLSSVFFGVCELLKFLLNKSTTKDVFLLSCDFWPIGAT